MRVPLFQRTLRPALRFGVLALVFVCMAHTPAAAQNCSFGCTVVYATQDTNQGTSCFSLNSSTCSSANPLTSHVSFGLTVDFFQPTGQTFGSHSATSGTCPGGVCTGNSFFDTGTMSNPTDYYVTFDGHSTAGGNLNAGSYNYFCIPHGAGMRGVLIVDPDGTTVSLSRTAGPNPSIFGQSVTFTATVNNNVFFSSVTPTGTVTFEDFGVAISAPLTLISGSRSFAISSLSGGVHSITAVYTPANGNFSGSTSGALSHTVNAANTSTALALTSGTNPATAGQSVSFTASVSNTSGTGVVPTGTATFEDNGTPLGGGTIALDGAGHAVFTTSALAGGTHPITAVFNANSNFNGSASSVINEAVHDFTLSISNPVQSVLPNQTATFNGTLSAFGGYSSTITVICQGSPPATCTGASVPLAANAQNVPFTVTASNPAVANFSFSISGSGVESLTHAVPVTLSVGSFSFSQPTPSSVSAVQGSPNDPSSPITFQISSLGSFAGEVDLNCPSPPSGVACIFSNGASTQALTLSPGQVINDTLVLNTSSSVSVGSHPVTIQATPVAAPGQFQTRSVTLNETAGAGPASVTLVYFGPYTSQGWPGGPAFTYPYPSTAPTLVGIGVPYTFKVTAVDYSNYNSGGGCTGAGACDDSTGVQLLISFSEPVTIASAVVSFNNSGSDNCVTQSSTATLCNLHTITYASPFYKEITVNVVPPFGRKVDAFVMVSSSVPNPGYPSCSGTYANNTCTLVHATTRTRPRPMVRAGQNTQNTNPK
ncbi:MAG: hypothetical protein DMG67_00255 [Acidobacteria bacterium]|nr:MAG: hypothetical protein DMG67_00255 [Acidobacteriota bacterium]